MGCDIHLIAQRRLSQERNVAVWAEAANAFEDVEDDFFDCRSYALFGFLAGVRNYSAIEPISPPRGIPEDFHDETHRFREQEGYTFYHDRSWLTLQELLDHDYAQVIEDRRVTIGGDGGCTSEPGGGKAMPLRDFLGDWYFAELERMKEAGVDRIVFCFDN